MNPTLPSLARWSDLTLLGLRVLTGAFLIAFVVFALGTLWLFTWMQRPKVADFLIELSGPTPLLSSDFLL